VPVPPAELSATCTLQGDRALELAAASGIAHESGPSEVLLSGARADVLRTVTEVVEASLDAGARTLTVRFDAPTESR
jgi:uncharacterized protein YqgV (UPF0045/DUF77 family)